MEAWIAWARGPLFRFSLAFMVLGLLRLVILTGLGYRRALRQAGDPVMPHRSLLRATREWLLPVRRARERPLAGAVSILFHVPILVVPLFLAGHLALWEDAAGLGLPAIPYRLADVLTLVAVAAGLGLILQRVGSRDARGLSRASDYLLILLIMTPFLTGYLVRNPEANPFPFAPVFLVHILSADLTMLAVPLTKISHCLLMPAMQYVAEVGWHLPPEAGRRVGEELGRARESI
jgi:nitrate reductase gamma subunit